MLTVNYTEDDIVQASILHTSRAWRRKAWFWRLFVFLYLAVFSLILWQMFEYYQDYQYYLYYFGGHTGFFLKIAGNLLILVFLCIAPSYLRWLLTRAARKHYRQYQALHHPVHYEWDNAFLRASSDNGQTKTPWTDYIRAEENPSTILLYASDMQYQTFPKRCFNNEDELNDFRRHALSTQTNKTASEQLEP